MKQTAVEWLVEQLDGEKHLSTNEINRIIQQSKEMENNQRLEDFKQGFHSAFESLESANKLVQSRTFKSE